MHGRDTEKQIFFYDNEFYPFSNFSAFAVEWKGRMWMTSEHIYHSEKFSDDAMKEKIFQCRSAHDAQKMAFANEAFFRPDFPQIRLAIMKEILKAKLEQHPYVKKKLIESARRELVEDSWRDSFWGWGPNKDGQNMLGKLWMEIRDELA